MDTNVKRIVVMMMMIKIRYWLTIEQLTMKTMRKVNKTNDM